MMGISGSGVRRARTMTMTDGQPGEVRRAGLRTVRMEAFSDGVFATTITLLVLEIAVPEGSGDDLLGP